MTEIKQFGREGDSDQSSRLTEEQKLGYITTTSGMSGYFAIWVKWYDDLKECGPYQDVFTSGIGRYRTKQEAENEAKSWAAAEEIPYKEFGI